MLEAQSLTLNYGEKNIIENLNLIIPKGEITVLVGANGCGKSTLLRSLARLMKPKSGDIVLNGDLIKSLPTKEIAKRMAILPQGPIAPEGLTVQQLAKQGRYPYQSWRKQWSKDDEDIVNEALRATGMSEFKNKPVNSLSGGQRQRAWIAMTLAQKTNTILLDEPTTYLDMTHQVDILDLLFELNEKEKRTIVMVLHDLNLACRYAHHIVAVRNKGIYVQGQPEEVVTGLMVKDVFQMNCDIIQDPIFGTPLCIPHGKGRKVVGKRNREREVLHV
ncbi:iron-enterobactin transporter ATP-binding protein [Alkalihalobacillus alcalophilus ATCC 27647 = CGMCC 1.3604]|uniref:ABC transporter n=1 Tax=Alkalihalobacillus alcalophilus ATCC 27647 = CGMCC 1.3604 TaxID=1218173 RepID=A0A094WJ85_ALKAL|nr:ABC transporter ATP-binding protein [Alkalihalobacillus alcalophilus]KGA96023.1 ABC transporter [Alkalihalobacillus alcalophilus ATCC 27647 = CGMCC 1.3604]MED1561286.1 ABC transporter ATP-binding protein [Alkalihalobacillus alcalophilus]THG91871.1 iron-enterobactin transporter ATP-binding protein [Alkalihalobacillus alcalophilus ATCC 27647 = CGMCC 1.3604]